MPRALLVAAAVFAGSWLLLMAGERLLHRLSHNPDRSYRWGVWTFSALAALFAFIADFGR